MKNVLKSLGKAALYFILFYGMQLLAGFVYGIVISTQLIMENGGQVDQTVMTGQIADALIQNAALIALISGILTLLTLLIFFKARKKKFLEQVDIKRVSIKALIWPILLGISFYLFISLLLGILPIPEAMMEQYSEASGSLFSGNIIISYLAVLIVAPIVEEIVFRGILLSRLSRSMPSVVAAIISSALFAVVHGNLLWMSYAFILGLVLCYVSTKYRSIIASISVHFLFNLMGVVMNLFDLENVPDALAFVLFAFGTAASIMLIIVMGRHKPVALEAEVPSIMKHNEEIGSVREET